VKKRITSIAPEYWKANLSSVRLQHVGNKKGYETGSHTEGLMAINGYEFLKKWIGLRDPTVTHSAILLLENK
jgi:hypothetical protein